MSKLADSVQKGKFFLDSFCANSDELGLWRGLPVLSGVFQGSPKSGKPRVNEKRAKELAGNAPSKGVCQGTSQKGADGAKERADQNGSPRDLSARQVDQKRGRARKKKKIQIDALNRQGGDFRKQRQDDGKQAATAHPKSRKDCHKETEKKDEN